MSHLTELYKIYMANPLPIDREEVRATYLATGSLKEAAQLHGIKEPTVRKWATRYEWETNATANKLLAKVEKIKEIKREHGHSGVPVVSRSADALASHLETSSAAFRSNLAGALARSSEALAEMDGYTALDNSRKMVDLATAASKVFPSMADEAKLQVNVLAMGLEGFVAQGA